MSDKDKIIKEITDSIQRINSKFMLLKLITEAKYEYDKYDYEAGRRSLIEAYLIDKKRKEHATFNIDSDLLKRLDKYTKKERRTKSSVVEIALEAHLKKEEKK